MSLAHDFVGEDNSPVKAGLVRGKQLGFYKRGRKSEEKGQKKKEEPRNRATHSTRRQQKTHKNRAINPKKKTEQRKHNQPKKIQSQERKHHTSPDFVPVRNKFSSKK